MGMEMAKQAQLLWDQEWVSIGEGASISFGV